VAGAGAEQHAPHAAALDLDRHRMILVGEKRHFRHERQHTRHLPDHALRVDDRVTRVEVGVGPLVDENLLRERIAARVENFDDRRRALIARAHVEQRLEARIFVARANRPLRGRTLLDEAALQRGIFLGQRALSDEIAADEGYRLAGHLRRALQRIKRDRDDMPDVFEVPVARVEKQHRQRDEAEEGQPRQRRRPPMEERGRLDRDVAHCGSASC